MAHVQAQMEAETSRIDQERRLAEQEALRQRQAIEDTMLLQRQRNQADAQHYRRAPCMRTMTHPSMLQLP